MSASFSMNERMDSAEALLGFALMRYSAEATSSDLACSSSSKVLESSPAPD